jgi:phenylacetate-CoA ligase
MYLTQLRNNQFTMASPGFNQEETFKVIKQFSHLYDQTILSCHPPVLKMLIEQGKKHHIGWENLNIKFLGAGEGFSENFRDYLLSLVGQTNFYNALINIYGSADAGLMGFETPLTIAIRRLTAQDNQLNQTLFNSERNPYLYQFDPRFKFLEAIDDELAITANATMPLIRYNIKDHGFVLPHNNLIDDLPQVIKNEILSIPEVANSHWKLPFVYVFGRKGSLISLWAVNIYPENIKAAVEHTSLQPFITGRFIVSSSTNKHQEKKLKIAIELKPNINSSNELKEKVKRTIINSLKETNSEYSRAEQNLKAKLHPHVTLHQYLDPNLFPEGKIKKMS